MVDKLPAAVLPEGPDIEVRPLIIIEHSLVEVKPMTTDGLLPIGSEMLLPGSPEVTVFEDQDALSCPLSPNRVREGHSQDMPAEGSIFDVSPDLPGFNMRPAGGGMQQPEIKQPPPSNYFSPLSPNRVREGHSQDMPAEGSIFDVSPDLPGFNMRPGGGRYAAA